MRAQTINSISLVLCFVCFCSYSFSQSQLKAQGHVFLDKNKNGVKDSDEPGIRGVRVSNQRDITTTDKNGKWELPYDDDTIFFVLKPRNYVSPIDSEKQIARFYYIHKPKGSPKMKYPAVEPTGPLPKSIDFPLYANNEPHGFRILVFGDTQPRDLREVEYIKRDIVEPLIGFKGAFGVVLGDIVFDDLVLFDPLTKTIAQIGIPWYYVLGNHDIDFLAPNHESADDAYEAYYGPSYYSFDYGPVHFVVLNNVKWHPANPELNQRGRYTSGLGRKQLEWLKNDLNFVPKNQLVVLMMHIPITELEEKEEVFRLLEDRPFSFSMSAHTHYQEHLFLKEEHGWKAKQPHHHFISVTACGSWWQGAPDEFGIPHTTMRSGAPNGYSIITFTGNSYFIEFFAARRPENYQMHIQIPDEVPMSKIRDTKVYVNVFAGSEKSTVEMRLHNTNTWTIMNKVSEPDPWYQLLFDRDKELAPPYRALPRPMNSPHLWVGSLPRHLSPGIYTLEVKTRDMFNKVYTSSKVFAVTK